MTVASPRNITAKVVHVDDIGSITSSSLSGFNVAVILAFESHDFQTDKSIFSALIEHKIHVVLWGMHAQEMEDALDQMAEDNENLDLVTTSHSLETANEVAEFIAFGVAPGASEISCVIITLEGRDSAHELYTQIMTFAK